MLNEGIVTSDAKVLMKSEMLRQIWQLRAVTPDIWERRVFQALTGQRREDVDWELEDNQAGYYTWIKSFDGLIEELIEDGYVVVEAHSDGSRTLKATEADPPLAVSPLVAPGR